MNTKTRSNHVRFPKPATLAVTFALATVLCVIPLFQTRAANPTMGTINVATVTPVTWDGNAVGTGSAGGEGTCVENDPHMPGDNCDTFTLTVGGTGGPTGDWATAGKRIEVKLSWANSGDDFDLYIHKTDNNGPIVDSSGHGAGRPEVAHISPATDGVGVFTVHVVYFVTVPGDQYHGTATVVPLTPPAPPAATADTGPKVGYENFEAPGVLTPVTVSTGPTVEYMGRGAGEPSIGVNWNSPAPNNVTGVTNFQSDLETSFITFANSCPTGGPTATWANRAAPTSVVIDSDPIGFTDRQTGRVFAAELTATSPTCKISYSDNDGMTWVPTTGPLGSGIDHETIGGGPYHAPLMGTPGYANAVYYCSQDLVAAFCLRSDDGGATFGPTVPTYTSACDGLHGHVKVSPKDGTVYLPNNSCGANLGAVVVSEDNGITWNVRPVKNATFQTSSGNSDPAVGIDNNGRVYFAMANADSAAAVATSDDHGNTWNNIVDVGAVYGLQNIRYPAAVAADAGRAAVAFYGSTTAGSANSDSFSGLWHLYVAHTFDGGLTWTTSDVTPGAPMQRGAIWTGGGARISRNLLDFFDITVDKQGRVEVGYVNGCPGGHCAQAAPTAKGNAYSATATIARQSSGRRLLAAFDPSSATSVPGMPSITQRRVGPVVHLGWSEADIGNSTITSYSIMRGTKSGSETLLTTVPGTQTSYDDLTATDITKTYYYKVVATNGVGVSCANNEIAAPYVGDTCSGLIIHQNLSNHPESAAANTSQALAIDYIAVGEPPSTTNFLFKMKVGNLNSVPPNSRWRMVWDSFSSPGQQYYVGMTTGAMGPPTFEYGTITTAVVALVIGVPTEKMVGLALPQSNFQSDGTITIYLPKSAVGNPQPGDLLGAVNGRTFDSPGTNERSTFLVDHTFVKAQTDNAFPAATYTVVGNVSCATPTPTPTPTPNPLPCSGTTVEDDDSHIAYSNGWHLINNSNASAGHFRLNEGGDNTHNAVLTFDDTALTGSVTYFYATSPKGGSAEVFVDGQDKGSVNYNGPSGSNRSPIFGASMIYNYGPTMGGHHTLEIRPIHDAVYVDGFCLPSSAAATGTPSTHPGNTDMNDANVSAGQEVLRSITLPSGTQAISIAAEPSVAVPMQLVLIAPSGSVLQTASSSTGVVVLEAPITQSGVYIIKEVNLSVGPVQVWSVATPLVSTSLVSQMSNGPPTGQTEGTPQGGSRSSLLSKILVEVCERVLRWPV